MTRILLLALLLPLFLTSTPVRAAPCAIEALSTPAIDAYVQERMGAWDIPGLSLVVVSEGQVIYVSGYGEANRETGTLMTADTPVVIGSTTKGMTALAIMQLVERGLVELDAPVVRYIPDLMIADERVRDITVRHLLSHTSGIPASFEPERCAGSRRARTACELAR